MLQQLFCAHCHTALSGAIDVRSGDYPAGRTWTGYDPKPLTDPGHAILSCKPMVWSEGGEATQPLQFVPQYWLNPIDVDKHVENAPHGRGQNGCCGPSGHGGPNQCCSTCGVDVGTLMADCWTDLVFIPQRDETYWTELK